MTYIRHKEINNQFYVILTLITEIVILHIHVPIYIYIYMHVGGVCSVVTDSLQPHGLQPTLHRLLCSWNFAGKDTAVGCQFLLQQIFLFAGRFITTVPPGKSTSICVCVYIPVILSRVRTLMKFQSSQVLCIHLSLICLLHQPLLVRYPATASSRGPMFEAMRAPPSTLGSTHTASFEGNPTFYPLLRYQVPLLFSLQSPLQGPPQLLFPS